MLYNLDQVTTISVYKKSRNYNYTKLNKYINTSWFNQNILGRKKTLIDRYESWNGDRCYNFADFIKTIKKENCYLDESDQCVYYKPYIMMKMSCQTIHTKWFDSVEALDKFIDSIKAENKNMSEKTLQEHMRSVHSKCEHIFKMVSPYVSIKEDAEKLAQISVLNSLQDEVRLHEDLIRISESGMGYRNRAMDGFSSGIRSANEARKITHEDYINNLLKEIEVLKDKKYFYD
jgi:hypothetical protein